MKKEYIIRVQMKSGGYQIFRAWGWSAGDAYQNLKKGNPDIQYKIDAKAA